MIIEIHTHIHTQNIPDTKPPSQFAIDVVVEKQEIMKLLVRLSKTGSNNSGGIKVLFLSRFLSISYSLLFHLFNT